MTPGHAPFLFMFSLCVAGCPAAPPADGDAQAAAQLGAEVPAGGEASATEPAALGEGAVADQIDTSKLTFDRYLSPGAPTVVLHVVVQGIDRGQIDFTSFESGQPGKGPAEIVHCQRFETSTFDIVVPAGFERELFVSASTIGEDGAPSDKGEVVSTEKPVVSGSEDLTITLIKDPRGIKPTSEPPGGMSPEGVPGLPPVGGRPTPTGFPPAGEQAAAGEAPAQP
jgi:hypothetical protein